jgi:hypothetical protein
LLTANCASAPYCSRTFPRGLLAVFQNRWADFYNRRFIFQ